jgi:hypothetical protein
MDKIDTTSTQLSTPPRVPRRRRGGQPGNTNALKSGLYARLFRASELARLQDITPASLQDEIDMFRLIIRRLIQRSGDIADLDMEMRYIVVLSHALGELTRMVKVQNLLPSSSEAWDAFQQALDELAQEWANRTAEVEP